MNHRISTMYSFVRQRMNGGGEEPKSLAGNKGGKETYTSYKCKCLAKSIVQNRPS